MLNQISALSRLTISRYSFSQLRKLPYNLSFSSSQTKFLKITEDNYKDIQANLEKIRDLEKLRQYCSYNNLVQLLNLVRDTKMDHTQKMRNYTIVEKVCLENNEKNSDSDMQFNILANVYSEKSKILLSLGNITEAIVESERAVEAISGMENPFYVQNAMLCYSAGNLHLQMQSFQKAQKYYKQSEHNMKLALQQMSQFATGELNQQQQKSKKKSQIAADLFFAKLYAEFTMLYMHTNRILQAKDYIQKSFQNWQKLPYRNILPYLSTVKYHCLLLLSTKNQKKAASTAEQYLSEYKSNPQTMVHRLWFMKFLTERGYQKYAEELKQNIQQMSKQMNKQQLQTALIRAGILSTNKNNKQKPS